MDRFERGAKGKTEGTQEVVKGVDDDVSSADLRREAAVAAQNQAAAEQPASEPSFVVDIPLPGGGDGPGLVTEVQSLAPEDGTSSPLVVPPDGDDQDEDDDPDADEYAASDLKTGIDTLASLTEPSRLLPIEDLDFSVTPAEFEILAGLGGDEIAWLKSDDLDPGTSIPPVQGWINKADFLDVQLKAEDNPAESLHGYGTVSGLPRDDAFGPGVTQLVGDEIASVRGEPGMGQDNVGQMIDGDPDRPILGESLTGNLTTDGELDRGPVMLNTDEPQPIDPQVTGINEGGIPGEQKLEFIIGDFVSRPNWLKSGEDQSGFDTPEHLSTGVIGEQELEFKSTSGMDDKQTASEMTDAGEGNDVALGGPDTATQIFGLPEVPNVADAFAETDPLGMTKADVISEISVEPLSYDQAATMTSSLDDDDDDPLDGM